MKQILAVTLLLLVMASFAYAEPVKHGQCWTVSELTELDKENVAGGKGTLHGEFAFIRDNARDEDAITEIGFMTLKHGAFIGLHSHADNEDAYLILSGTGIFTDGSGNAYVVRPGDMTIARPGQWHGLANINSEELVFLDIIAKNGSADLEAIKANPTPQYFPADKLFDKNVEHAGGTGEGTLYGKFAFRREQADINHAIKEIGLMTLKPGDSIGLHKHDANEDTYIILAGKGLFVDGEGNEYIVGPESVTIAVAGESHSLKNIGTEDLVFIDLIAQNHALRK
ncbi:MAG: cupin domain-containing protein [Synergistaceae bacterium]|nr:cupin domain-containing protein [Synergistaceae bacterium]